MTYELKNADFLKNRNRQVVNGCLRRDDMQNITGERNLQDKKREQKYERKKVRQFSISN